MLLLCNKTLAWLGAKTVVIQQAHKIIFPWHLLLIGRLDDFARLALRHSLGDDRQSPDRVRVVEGVHGGFVHRAEGREVDHDRHSRVPLHGLGDGGVHRDQSLRLIDGSGTTRKGVGGRTLET